MTILLEKAKLDTIKGAIEGKLPVMLIGETGIGKTTIVSQLANELGYSLTRLSLNDQVGREDLIGRMGLNGGKTVWQDGALTTAMRNGEWIVLDELNSARPEVLFALHSLLDDERAIVLQEKDNERVQAHKDFRLFATINPVGYHGTKNLNQAFVSRFVVVGVEVLPKSDEVTMIVSKTGVNETTASTLVSIATKLRKFYTDGQIEYFCSTRDLIMAASLIAKKVPLTTAVSSTIFNKVGDDDIEFITDNAGDVKNLLAKAGTDALSMMKEIEELRTLKINSESVKNELAVNTAQLATLKVDLGLLNKEIKLKVTERNKAEKEAEIAQIKLDHIQEATEKEKAALAKEYIKNHF